MPDFSNITPYQTRQTLIAKCKEKDEAAWMAFYEPYRKYAFIIIRHFYPSLSVQESEELAHEVMVRVVDSIERFDPEMPSRYNLGERVKFRTWFYNQIRTVVNKRNRRDEKYKKIFDCLLKDTDCTVEDARFHEEREQMIQNKAMELLAQGRTNKRNIEAFQMFLNGRSVTDIAWELGMSENSVHQAVCRCRHSLVKHRKELEEVL